MSVPPVLVLGAGTVGLSTAWRLLEAGYNVCVASHGPEHLTTSWGAGAVWCYPAYELLPAEDGARWNERALETLWALASEPETGVHLRWVYDARRSPISEDEKADIRTHVREFREEAAAEILAAHPAFAGRAHPYCDAIAYQVPCVDVPIHMAFLRRRIEGLGGTFVSLAEPLTREELLRLLTSANGGPPSGCSDSDRGSDCHAKDKTSSADEGKGDSQGDSKGDSALCGQRFSAVVNCCGLGAGALLGTHDMRALRGDLVLVHCPEVDAVYFDDGNPDGMTYIIPRLNGMCVLGGVSVHTPDTHHNRGVDGPLAPEQVAALTRRCALIHPAVAHARVDNSWSRFRPARIGGVRLEIDRTFVTCNNSTSAASPAIPLLHNYGHGGSGIVAALPTAEDIVALLATVLPPPSKAS